jgi:CBS domain-containing protein/anti-sigma regulatory factor (Ser/Thr protein kinase)
MMADLQGVQGGTDKIATPPTELTVVQELVYELKVDQVMTRDVITCCPDQTMAELKEVLRVNHISGVPIVQDGQMVGMVSVENLIKALEQGEADHPIREKMTRGVQAVRADDSLAGAVSLFARYRYGRFPVVDGEGRLVGILTQGDIVRALLKRLEALWHSEEIRRYRASHIFEDIESEQTTLILRYRVQPQDFMHGGEASSKVKRALERLGAHPQLMRRISVATYEAETNIMIHTVGGEIMVEARPDKIKVVALDQGPGIPDVEKALQPGYSTASDLIRELGFGAGMGLSNIRACTDRMTLNSVMGEGTRLEMVFDLTKGSGQ